jgi:hypothetical protein
MTKQARKRIAELLLRQRLGLDEDWLNRDEDGTVRLPSSLPVYLAQRHSKQRLRALEEDLDRLVAEGCRREALYFCLAQLSPDVEEMRAGREWGSVASKDGGDDVTYRRKRRLATREDLAAVANKARAARRVIHKYRSELLLAAGLKRCLLPAGMFTELPDPDEALSLLTDSLTWVAGLAKSYATPYETTLLKSKGLLYLTLYVSMHADAKAIRSPEDQPTRIPARRKERTLTKRAVHPADKSLARMASFCTGKTWAPSDLLGKLKKFEGDYPTLHAKMKAKLAELHRNATG